MNKKQLFFVWSVVGIMVFSALALSVLAFMSGNDDSSANETTQEDIVIDQTDNQPVATVPDFSELLVEDIREGDGQVLKLDDVITVNYKLTLSDGTPVAGNDTFASGQPATFPFQVGSLIEGWTTGLVGLKVGGLRKLEVPSTLGYGEFGSPPAIPGNAGLVFEVELLSINEE